MAHDEATFRQIAAARPDRSTWLSANAGSGKTKVLTDRVARLLLDGVNPQNILCLTYTKAAASEMQNRLFERLGRWVMLTDRKLKEELTGLGHGTVIRSTQLAEARRLFASAIETPGGLKIQTIHSFCSSILRRFPLEAGVTPQFTEMEERAAALLRTEIVERLADEPEAERVLNVARHFSGKSLETITDEIVRHRGAFRGPVSDEALARSFGLPPGYDEAALVSQVFLGSEQPLLNALVPALAVSGPQDQKAGAKLQHLGALDLRALPVLESVFLTGAKATAPFSAKIGSFPTRPCREAMPAAMPELEALMARVEATRARRVALGAMRRARALHDFAEVFLPEYTMAKQLRGWLDFDDLILNARDLLTDRKVADWVLYKLDGGIDHILVDEAQDTSPVQWEVIECLAREFTSGEGSKSEVPRTIFVVGDKKQSIYSFQGADPDAFDRMKADFAERLSETPLPLQDLRMEFSFRSSQILLSLVDEVFRGRKASGFVSEHGHTAFKADMPGRVDLWPLIEKPEQPEDPEWFDPVDVKAPDDPAKLLAQRVAGAIKEMIGQPLPDKAGTQARPIEPGDVLVLVRRRSDVFHDIIRECKEAGLPVAGADRLKVGGELAVKDLGALLAFLATPEDSLSLATALRSPLFGWSEAELYGLAHGRAQRYLWAELRDRAEEFPRTMAVLEDLRDQLDYLRPFELIERILTRHDGRRRLLARLGPEAEDGIDALLTQAMADERNAVDSLTGFLVWMETDELEIKRQMDSAGNRIRVMTVHGAKGLEAPIVILPDTANWQHRHRNQLGVKGDMVIWRSPSDEATALQKEMDEAAREADEAERDRLLYVAMTRAEQWLIVAAAGDLGKERQSWHDKVREGMERLGATPLVTEGGAGLRLESGEWAGLPMSGGTPGEAASAELPAFYALPAPAPASPWEALSPSALGGAKALPGEEGLDEDAAKRRGRQVHRLLEVLPDAPREAWPDVAARLLSFGEDAAKGEELALLLGEATKVLTKPVLRALFEGDALVEVPISATVPLLDNRRIHGVIDRLIVRPEKVQAIDFKTNALAPDSAALCPDGLLRQMGAYAHALAQLYPEREIETALLWTRTATLMPLPHDLVTDALANTQIP